MHLWDGKQSRDGSTKAQRAGQEGGTEGPWTLPLRRCSIFLPRILGACPVRISTPTSESLLRPGTLFPKDS